MKPTPLEPLDPELAALFRASRCDPPAGAKDRVRARLAAAVAGTGLGAAATASAASKVPAGASGTLASPVLLAGATVLVALAGGLLWTALPHQPGRARDRQQLPVAQAITDRKIAAPSGGLAGPDLGAEHRLLSRARAALAQGDLAGARAALEQHESSFAAGLLNQERETLWIVTLAKAGELAEASARARRFARSYPDSIFRQTIDRAIQQAIDHRP
jgi:hypothetical protein